MPPRDSSATEAIRRGFKPDKVRVLFVGESAPAGPTFFYEANSNLYRHFRAVFDGVAGTNGFDAHGFFERFRGLGCYLDDLCREPVNNLPKAERQSRCAASEPGLAQRIRDARPEVVVAIGKTFAAPSIRRALKQSGVVARFEVLPFPNWPDQQKAFAEQASELIQGLVS